LDQGGDPPTQEDSIGETKMDPTQAFFDWTNRSEQAHIAVLAAPAIALLSSSVKRCMSVN
jgi:hypothetical protein